MLLIAEKGRNAVSCSPSRPKECEATPNVYKPSAALSGAIPKLYNIEPEVRALAARLMLICALTIPIEAIVNELYFIIRSGGQMSVTIIFDSGFTWVVLVPAVAILVRLTPLAVPLIYLIDRLLTLLKTVLGAVIFRRGRWMRQL